MPYITCELLDVVLTCTWVFMRVDGSTCSESLPERTCHFEPPEHLPRTSTRAQAFVRGPGGLPSRHWAESTRKDPRPEEKQMPKGQKNTFIHIHVYIDKAPLLGVGWSPWGDARYAAGLTPAHETRARNTEQKSTKGECNKIKKIIQTRWPLMNVKDKNRSVTDGQRRSWASGG